jgi:hypothetical protein
MISDLFIQPLAGKKRRGKRELTYPAAAAGTG